MSWQLVKECTKGTVCDEKTFVCKSDCSIQCDPNALMRCSGKNVQVRYREYRGYLPWRGMQRYIVYDILSVTEPVPATTIPVETD